MDPREKILNDAARRVITENRYDPHFASSPERLDIETKLFLARFDALMKHTADKKPRWRHRVTDEVVTEIGRGTFLEDVGDNIKLYTRLIAYRDKEDFIGYLRESDFRLEYEELVE